MNNNGTLIHSALSIVLCTGLFMVGCGGGGGDSTPPTAVSSLPSDGAGEVALDSGISATFSEALDPTSIDSSSFTLAVTGGAGVSGTVSYDAPSLTAGFTPSAMLDPDTDYTATITTAIRDLAGNPLATDYSFEFTTAAVADDWVQVGGRVSPAGAESEDPSMLLVGSTPAVGYRHASFISYLNIWDGSSWGTPEPDPTSGNTDASIYSTPDYCTIGQDVYLAYSHTGDSTANDDTFYDRIFVYRWNETGGWSVMNGGSEVSVVYNATFGGANTWEPTIACPASGNPRVAWVEADVVPDPDTEDGVWVAEVTPSSSTRSAILSRNNVAGDYYTDASTLGATIDAAGNTIVAQWEEDAFEQWLTNLYVTSYDGAAFTPLGGSIADDWDSNNLPVPALVTEGQDVYVAYSTANNTDDTRQVYVKKYHSGSWSLLGAGPVSAFSPSDHFTSNNPDLLLIDGTVWVAWEETSQTEGSFVFVAYFDTALQEWVIDGDRLNIDQANEALDPSLAYSPADGYLYVAFEEYSDGYPHIYVKRKKLNP